MLAAMLAVLVLIIAFIFPFILMRVWRSGLPFSPTDRVLLVIAHPDDESLFFSPTMLSLALGRIPTYALCLSSGNAEGKGDIRTSELVAACRVFSIPSSHLNIIDDPLLQDGMKSSWDISCASRHISKAVDKWHPTAVLTFDARGVSGHPNHIATFCGVLQSQLERSREKKVGIYCLESVNVIRKFISLLDLPLASFLTAKGKRIIISPSPALGWTAMMKHRSQMVWYRYLFLLLSSYTVFNVIVPISNQSFEN